MVSSEQGELIYLRFFPISPMDRFEIKSKALDVIFNVSQIRDQVSVDSCIVRSVMLFSLAAFAATWKRQQSPRLSVSRRAPRFHFRFLLAGEFVWADPLQWCGRRPGLVLQFLAPARSRAGRSSTTNRILFISKSPNQINRISQDSVDKTQEEFRNGKTRNNTGICFVVIDDCPSSYAGVPQDSLRIPGIHHV